MDVRNIIFSAIVSALLFACLGNALYQTIASIPEASSRSYLEGRSYQLFPEASPDTLTTGSFQSQFEQYIADLVPLRDNVLLANAKLQYCTISLSNILFKYKAWPTFYNSELLYCPVYESVVETPSNAEVETAALLNEKAAVFSEAIERHPNTRWQMALVDRSRISLSNPAHDLVSHPADYLLYQREFLDKLPSSCSIVDLSIKEPDVYFQKYFKTDHHWTIFGGADAYKAILENYDKATPTLVFREQYPGPFYGSGARSGLLTLSWDSLSDATIAPSIIKVLVDGKEQPVSWLNDRLDSEYTGYQKTHQFENVYADYFHGDPGLIEIQSAAPKGTLLIIGDSFTNCIDYLFSNDYSCVYILDPRSYDGSLEEFLDNRKVDDAVFLIASNNLISDKIASFLG